MTGCNSLVKCPGRRFLCLLNRNRGRPMPLLPCFGEDRLLPALASSQSLLPAAILKFIEQSSLRRVVLLAMEPFSMLNRPSLNLADSHLMILSFSAQTPEGHIRHFSIVCDDLGLCLDVLSLAITLGDTLLRAEIAEEQGSPLVLPLQAFNTNRVSQYLRDLQIEWERILA